MFVEQPGDVGVGCQEGGQLGREASLWERQQHVLLALLDIPGEHGRAEGCVAELVHVLLQLLLVVSLLTDTKQPVLVPVLLCQAGDLFRCFNGGFR